MNVMRTFEDALRASFTTSSALAALRPVKIRVPGLCFARAMSAVLPIPPVPEFVSRVQASGEYV